MITPAFNLTATERVLPRLALDFTLASLDPRVTFTRSGNTATVTNSSGFVVPINANLPRFDYNPVTLACKGLLIEESRANLFTYSEQFENAIWLKSNATVSQDAAVAPSGSSTADAVLETAVTATHAVSGANLAITSATAYTYSVYAKPNGRNWIVLQFTGGFTANAGAYFDLVNGVVGNTLNSPTATSITAVGNGWYRCSITATSNAALASYVVYLASANGTVSYAGDTSKGVYLWGAQFEAGAFPTSYIPTTTTALTRNADVASMTGTNFSDWYNQTQGSFQVSGLSKDTSAYSATRQIVFANNSGTANTYLSVGYRLVTLPRCDMNNAGVGSGMTTAGNANSGEKICFACKLSSYAMSTAGSVVATDSLAQIPTLNEMYIGRNSSGTTTSYLNGWVKTINYYTQRLINNEVRSFSKG